MNTADDDAFERARQSFLQGVQAFESGRLDEAGTHFEVSLALLPGRASTLTNLAAVRLAQGHRSQALQAADAALAVEPGAVDAWCHRAAALAGLGQPEQALEAFERALALDDRLGAAWTQRGTLLKDLGRLPQAARSFQRALELGEDPALLRYLLASVQGCEAPASAPRGYVETLFDGYADDFDDHLQALNYRAPQRLVARLPARARWPQVLDLGCGTGLLAPCLAGRYDALDGIDLSRRMLQRARQRGGYRHLWHGDVVERLAALPATYDLIAAVDVFIYVGDLAPVFAGAARALAASGCFAFSLEATAQGGGPRLGPSSRYAHPEGYVRDLAAREGWTVAVLERDELRREQQHLVDGLYVVLTR